MTFPFLIKAYDSCNFKFNKHSEEVYFSLNSTVILSCVPKYGSDAEICQSFFPPFIWFHNSNKVIEKENQLKIISQSQELVLFYATSFDAGEYLCDSENKDGPINKTFVLRLTESGSFQKTILANILPRHSLEEKKGDIYWLPEMLVADLQQNSVKNLGEDKSFSNSYYVSVVNTSSDSFQVEWYFQFEGSDSMIKIDDIRYREKVVEKVCNSNLLLPRNVLGKCYFSLLIVPNLNEANQGFYHSVARLTGTDRPLNLTYSLRINIAKIDEPRNFPNGKPYITFNLNSRACIHDDFEFNCKVTPDGNYYTTIEKVHSNSNSTVLAKTEVKTINITDNHGQVFINGNYIETSGLNHSIMSVTSSDAGVYLCTSVPINQITSHEQSYFVLRTVMELVVQSCIGSLSQDQPSTWHTNVVWPLIAITSVAFVLVLSICCYHYYFQSYLVKTVIVQHPNKLYVPHDTSSPLILPHVSIRTSHRFRLQHNNSSSEQKPLNRISNAPFSEKLSKYFQKTCIFTYRRVDASGSSPVVDTIGLSNPDSSKSSSNSTRDDSRSREIILKNSSRTQYRLPSNIGWVFSRDSLVIGSKIGEGAFGIVFDGIAKLLPIRSAPIEVAIKTLHDSFGDEDLINLVKEMEMLKLIGHHRHIIALYGAYIDNGHPYMVMELAKNGNLRDFLRSRRTQTNALIMSDCLRLTMSSITILDLLRFSLDIADGMEFLSSKMIIHRDLAARNILVDQYLEMKIADFGLTRAVENYYRKSTDGRLPIKWMAPECLLDRVYTVKSDVWSFGIVLWEIFSMGQTPYPTVQPDAMHQALRNGLRNDRPTLASEEIYNIMLAIWNDDPVERPSFTELVLKMSQIRFAEQVSSLRDTCDGDQQSINHDPSQRALIKDYLEISSNQCYSTTLV